MFLQGQALFFRVDFIGQDQIEIKTKVAKALWFSWSIKLVLFKFNCALDNCYSSRTSKLGFGTWGSHSGHLSWADSFWIAGSFCSGMSKDDSWVSPDLKLSLISFSNNVSINYRLGVWILGSYLEFDPILWFPNTQIVPNPVVLYIAISFGVNRTVWAWSCSRHGPQHVRRFCWHLTRIAWFLGKLLTTTVCVEGRLFISGLCFVHIFLA